MVKAHSRKWANVAVERDLLEPIQHLATEQGLHGYELIRKLVRDEAARAGEHALVPINQTDVPGMIQGLILVVRSLAETQTRALEELAKMRSELTLLDENSFIAVGRAQKGVIDLTLSQGLALDALDKLVRPGIKEKIVNQAKELSKREWPIVNEHWFGGRLPKDL